MQQKTELLKIRDFGQVISDTFNFLKENFKPLAKCFFTFCGFFIVATIALSIVIQLQTGTQMQNAFSPVRARQVFETFSDRLGTVFVMYAFIILFSLLNYTAMHVTVFSYMSLYKEKGNVPPTTEEVWGYFKYYFFRAFGTIFLLSLLLGIAFVLCLIPGIYLSPALGLVVPVMIFENGSLSYSFSKAFQLLRNNWWTTFGAIFVMIIIVYFISAIVMIPVTVITISTTLIQKGGLNGIQTLSIVSSVLSGLAQITQILPLITAALCYFSLSEQMEGTGLMGRINQLGNNNTSEQSTEEY